MAVNLRIGILAGESSGDLLGAGLMAALKRQRPDIVFEGIGGPRMIAEGLASRVPMERLSVMGLIDPLKRLPELLRIRRDLARYFIANPPDAFIGIDSPDFNLGLEGTLKKAGIRTAHYVSPSVWAWRRGRIRKIARAVDLMLCLFPFETEVYRRHRIPATFIGHPLADDIPLDIDTGAARSALALDPARPVLALLPGSRGGEVARMAPPFLETARRCVAHWPGLQIVLPCAGEDRRRQIETLIERDFSDLDVLLLDGRSREAMAAADLILIASGTATLEALLLKKPMLVCYRMGAVSYAIISRALKVPWFSLPNLLAGRRLVDELVQREVNADNLYRRLVRLGDDRQQQQELIGEYRRIHETLKKDASSRAAGEVLTLLGARP